MELDFIKKRKLPTYLGINKNISSRVIIIIKMSCLEDFKGGVWSADEDDDDILIKDGVVTKIKQEYCYQYAFPIHLSDDEEEEIKKENEKDRNMHIIQ